MIESLLDYWYLDVESALRIWEWSLSVLLCLVL